LRGKSAAAVRLALGWDMNLIGLMILAILNLRATCGGQAYGVTVAEAHNLQPIWIIPVLTSPSSPGRSWSSPSPNQKHEVSTADER